MVTLAGRVTQVDVAQRILELAFPATGSGRSITVIGIGPRLVARVIDTVLVFLLSLVVAAVVGMVSELVGLSAANEMGWSALTFTAGLLFSLAYWVSAWSKGGQTLGDMLIGLKVVTADGYPPSIGQAFVRYIGCLVSGLVLSLGFVWIALDRNRQGWHDKLARTYVIPAHQSFSSLERVLFTPADQGAGPIWLGMWVVLAFLLPSALGASLWLLGPFVATLVKNLMGATP